MLFLPVHIINHPALTFGHNYHTNLNILLTVEVDNSYYLQLLVVTWEKKKRTMVFVDNQKSVTKEFNKKSLLWKDILGIYSYSVKAI